MRDGASRQEYSAMHALSVPLGEYSGYELGNPDLPIANHRSEIERAIRDNQVVIVEGQTGSGKSTQIAQYAYDMGFDKIVETQPRIPAARSISERIAEEMVAVRGAAIARRVGFRTAEFGNTTKETKIVTATDGLALQWALFGRLFEQSNTLTIVDEAHEANKSLELLIARARLAMQDNPDMRVVISSATIDANALANYFSDSNGRPAPIIRVPGRMYAVEERDGGAMVDEIIARSKLGGDILAFVPGKAEIDATLREVGRRLDRPMRLLEAHGEQSMAEQSRIFAQYPEGKIIAATDIAKTSLTIDGIEHVVDSQWARLGHALHGVRKLDIVPAPWATRDQRKGRAGRTRPGTYTRAQLEGYPELPPIEKRGQYDVPEIQMTRIEDQVLRLRQAQIDPKTLVYFNRPSDTQIQSAEKHLGRIGALGASGEVTEIGDEMGYLSLDPSLARMVIEARKYGNAVSLQVAALAAVRQVNGIVRTDDASQPRWRHLTHEHTSDALAELDVFVAALGMTDAELHRNGIVDRRLHRARIKYEDICESEGLQMHLITKPSGTQRKQIILAMIPGAEELFIRTRSERYVDVRGGRRELRDDSVLYHGASLLIGQAFDLTVPGYKKFNTKRMMNGATEIDTVKLLQEYAPGRCEYRPVSFGFDRHTGAVIARSQLYFDDIWLKYYKKEPAKPSAELNAFLVRTLITEERLPAGDYPTRAHVHPIVRALYDLQERTTEDLGVESFVDDLVRDIAALLPRHMTKLEEVDTYLPILGGVDHIIPATVIAEIRNMAPAQILVQDQAFAVTYRKGKAIIHAPIEKWPLLPGVFPELGNKEVLVSFTDNASPLAIDKARQLLAGVRRNQPKFARGQAAAGAPAPATQLPRRALRKIHSGAQPNRRYGN